MHVRPELANIPTRVSKMTHMVPFLGETAALWAHFGRQVGPNLCQKARYKNSFLVSCFCVDKWHPKSTPIGSPGAALGCLWAVCRIPRGAFGGHPMSLWALAGPSWARRVRNIKLVSLMFLSFWLMDATFAAISDISPDAIEE